MKTLFKTLITITLLVIMISNTYANKFNFKTIWNKNFQIECEGYGWAIDCPNNDGNSWAYWIQVRDLKANNLVNFNLEDKFSNGMPSWVLKDDQGNFNWAIIAVNENGDVFYYQWNNAKTKITFKKSLHKEKVVKYIVSVPYTERIVSRIVNASIDNNGNTSFEFHYQTTIKKGCINTQRDYLIENKKAKLIKNWGEIENLCVPNNSSSSIPN